MLKYVDAKVVFAEVPDEVTLAINISNCPCQCKGCHSSYLAQDIGTELTFNEVRKLIKKNSGVSCIAIMGGDAEPDKINTLASFIINHYNSIKVAWYSGRQELSNSIDLSNFDYIKLGPYKEEFGPLNSRTTNQRFYKVSDGELVDITSRFYDRNLETCSGI
jgi:anaerobic ribonucleoside-triphosphate reductase activating protein